MGWRDSSVLPKLLVSNYMNMFILCAPYAIVKTQRGLAPDHRT